MDRYLYGEDDRLIEWVQSRIPNCLFREDATTIGLERDGSVRGAVIFDTFSPTSCFIHLASDGSRRWITRELIQRVFAYPFIQLALPRVNCVVSETNHDSLRLTRHFGWKQEGVLREAGSEGEDLVLFGMLRRECRFISPLAWVTGNPRRSEV